MDKYGLVDLIWAFSFSIGWGCGILRFVYECFWMNSTSRICSFSCNTPVEFYFVVTVVTVAVTAQSR
jgi:hypothetical protein